MKPEIISNEEYHSRPYMSATKLKVFLKSPAHCKAFIDAGDTDTPAFRVGRMVHHRVLEPATFYDQYAVFDGDRRTKAGKDEWAAIMDNDREPIKTEELAVCNAIREAVGHYFPPSGKPELSFKAEIDGVMCQCRTDWLVETGMERVQPYDLKTCQDVSQVDRVFYSYAYDVQSVFYRMVLEACGYHVEPMQFIFVEKKSPYDVAVRVIDPAIEVAVEKQIRTALADYKACCESGKWPGVEGVDPAVKIAPAPAWRVGGIVDVDLSGFYSDENEAC